MENHTASISDFDSQKAKMPGDRVDIAAVGQYILELYTDPMGQRPRVVIEVNELTTSDDGRKIYTKAGNVWFNPDDVEDDPEDAARSAFDEMKNSVDAVEAYLTQ